MNRNLLIVAVLAATAPHTAQAYVDPGSGYLIWQLVASLVVGALLGFRKLWSAAGRLFRKSTPPGNLPAAEEKKAA